jgi:hypothetical protein
LSENLKIDQLEANRPDTVLDEDLRRQLSTNDIDGDEDLSIKKSWTDLGEGTPGQERSASMN